MNLIKKLKFWPWPGAIHMYTTIIAKQVYWYMYMYIFQISGERLHDHWSSSSFSPDVHVGWDLIILVHAFMRC